MTQLIKLEKENQISLYRPSHLLRDMLRTSTPLTAQKCKNELLLFNLFKI